MTPLYVSESNPIHLTPTSATDRSVPLRVLHVTTREFGSTPASEYNHQGLQYSERKISPG